MTIKPDFDVRYVFDPLVSGDDDRLCSRDCRFRAVGRDRWFFGLERVYAVCQLFERNLEVFADGSLDHKVKRCRQCVAVERLLVPTDYVVEERQLRSLPIVRNNHKQAEPEEEDEFERALRANGKGHLVQHFRGNVSSIRRAHR